MATNHYFSQKVRSEQNLYEDIIIESLKIYGQDVYYLPREIVNEIDILGDDVSSRFSSSYKLEMYIENTEGFDGEGDLFTKFGVEIRDQATFIVSRKRWNATVGRYDNEINSVRPREGDLIYLTLSNSMFQIMHVEHESPFYQISNLPTYKLRCELFEYSNEDFDTDVAQIDGIELDYAYAHQLTLDSASLGFTIGETISQTLANNVIITGEVVAWSDSDSVLKLVNVGADDGQYHTFTAGSKIFSAIDQDTREGFTQYSSATVTAVTEINQLSENEQNEAFDGASLDFLDFSEDNPFGDPS